MELWIRSQDKRRLTKVLELEMTSSGYYGSIDMPYSVLNQDEVWLGSYKTKERALEILDEIQNILQPTVIYHEPEINYDDMIQSLTENVVLKTTQKVDFELKQAGQIVYQMPKE